MNRYYEVLPISEKPEKPGFYFTLMGERTANNWFKEGKWLDEILSGKPTEVTHWLRPIEKIPTDRDTAEKAWNAGAESFNDCKRVFGDSEFDREQHEWDKQEFLKQFE